jgi:2-polyprenyl-3-methyl-5-hydroxy-6-metoxy-1,4-benzoquinol methylase
MYSNPFPIPVDSEKLYGDPNEYFAMPNHDEKIKTHTGFLRNIKKRVGHLSKVIDVGSGCGELLVAARNEGIDAVGLEFSEAMIRYGQEKLGVTIQKLSIEAAAEQWPASFDAVVLSAVLEHVYDPNLMIQAASKLLRPSGILYIDVPNEPSLLTSIGNLFAKATGKKNVFNLSPTWPPYHVYGFNPRSLHKLLGKHGLKIEELKVWADPRISAKKDLADQLKSKIAYGINQIANLTNSAGDLHLWARKL